MNGCHGFLSVTMTPLDWLITIVSVTRSRSRSSRRTDQRVHQELVAVWRLPLIHVLPKVHDVNQLASAAQLKHTGWCAPVVDGTEIGSCSEATCMFGGICSSCSIAPLAPPSMRAETLSPPCTPSIGISPCLTVSGTGPPDSEDDPRFEERPVPAVKESMLAVTELWPSAFFSYHK